MVYKDFSRLVHIMSLHIIFMLLAHAPLLAFTTGDDLIFSQDTMITVSGRVLDTFDNEPLIGVNVAVKEDATRGTVTDLDGNYTLNVPVGATLIFSYVGFVTEQVLVTGETNTIDVSLSQDLVTLNTIVVTAVGIKRDKASLGYAVQDVRTDEIDEARENNVVNALSGKITGVQISRSATGPAGSSRVVIRGSSSLAGANDPLYVVDGIPINNQTGGGVEFGGIDFGDGISNINPDDIESVSVLKGAAAAALYGSRAQNGVIMITTKSGEQRKGIGISFNSNFTFEEVLVQPEFQDIYGRGSKGNSPASDAGFNADVISSWGRRFDGVVEENWTGAQVPYAAQEDNIRDFWRTGTTFTNSLALIGGGEKTTARFSITDLRNEGIQPNSEFNRTSLALRANSKLTERLSLDAKVNYVKQRGFNRPNLALSPDNPQKSLIEMPRNIRLSDLKDFRTSDLLPRVINNVTAGNWQNPYWAVNLNTNEDDRDRIISFASLKYDFTDWISLQLRSGIDYYYDRRENRNATNTVYRTNGDKAFYSLSERRVEETNSDFLITITPSLKHDLAFTANLGGNIRYFRSELIGYRSEGLNVPDLFTISNATAPIPDYEFSEKEVHSLFGSAQISHKDRIHLDLTLRNDWSSTLPSNNWSYLYPSAALSVIWTDFFLTLPRFVDFGKLRVSWAQVGNDTNPYALDFNYFVGPLSHGGQTFGNVTPTLPLLDLQPEETTSWEAGTELKLFRNRLGLDFTYYNAGTRNQILNVAVDPASGFRNQVQNAGLIRNKGVELGITGTVLEDKNGLTVETYANFTRNVSEIEELADGLDVFPLGQTFDVLGVVVQARVGDPFGDIYALSSYRRNENGERIIDEFGLPVRESVEKKIGNFQPDWLMGIGSRINYKRAYLSFLVDIRQGGEVFSYSNAIAAANGNADYTLEGRRDWYAEAGGYLAQGVFENGERNDIFVDPQDYWNRVGGRSPVGEEFVYDASFVKLREVTAGFNFPTSWISNTPFKKVSFSVIGRNLWIIHKNTPGFDPEASFNAGNSQGIEAYAFPSTRSVGFNLNLEL